MPKSVEPSIRATAFNCPHCSAFTTQYWYSLYADALRGEKPIPVIPTEMQKQTLLSNPDLSDAEKTELVRWINKLQTGLVSLSPEGGKFASNPRPFSGLERSQGFPKSRCKTLAAFASYKYLLLAALGPWRAEHNSSPDHVARDHYSVLNQMSPLILGD